MTPEDAAAKAGFIAAFFQSIRSRVAFTQQLWEEGRTDEALLLVSCYIDGLGQRLHPRNAGSAATFVRVLRDHGCEPSLLAILPTRLMEKIPRSGTNTTLANPVRAFLSTLLAHEALAEGILLAAAKPHLDPASFAHLERNIYRGTVASIAYEIIRSLNVHMLGSPGAVTFSATTFQGARLADISYPVLRRAVDSIVDHADELSRRTNKWFGT